MRSSLPSWTRGAYLYRVGAEQRLEAHLNDFLRFAYEVRPRLELEQELDRAVGDRAPNSL